MSDRFDVNLSDGEQLYAEAVYASDPKEAAGKAIKNSGYSFEELLGRGGVVATVSMLDVEERDGGSRVKNFTMQDLV